MSFTKILKPTTLLCDKIRSSLYYETNYFQENKTPIKDSITSL